MSVRAVPVSGSAVASKMEVELTKHEQEAVQKRMQALDKLLQTEDKAKYKIEIVFTKSRSLHKPTPGIISLWESGTKLHGGGDSLLYICAGKKLGKNDCEAILQDVGEGFGHLVCPKCGLAWKGPEVIGQDIGVHTMQQWAELVLSYYVKLGHNADIYAKHARDDLRAAQQADPKKFGGEKLTAVRDRRVVYIYPLKNLIKDCSAGADILNRIFAFLTA